MGTKKIIKALLLGDVIGDGGSRALFVALPQLIRDSRADIVIVNGENAADGFGISENIALQIFSLGVDVITSGNHIWQKSEITNFLNRDKRLLRPANYAPQAPGKGDVIIEKQGFKFGVINLQGRHQMAPIDCPFKVGSNLVDKIRKETPIILVDFHAENEQEKEALGLYFDGKVTAVVGTHTHVQTADEKILAKGTSYITDLGLCGPTEGVIGSDAQIAIDRQLTQLPLRSKVAQGPAQLQGVFITIDASNGKSLSIKRVSEKLGV
jgi:metallophosphoesterase (TIGR00282 family)